MKAVKGFMIAVGIASIAMAGIGLLYNIHTLFPIVPSDITLEHDTPYFYPAFYIMWTTCFGCYIILLICGIQFIRLRINLLKLFVGIIIFEIVYFFLISTMWLAPHIGKSIAAATGVANGALSIQIFSLFFLWAPLIAVWATGKLRETKVSNEKIQAAGEP